jgi:hypothetical protein
MDAAVLLAALAKELWSSALVGTGTPEGRERFQRMRQPQLDDVVFVWLTRRDADPAGTVGRFDSCWSYLTEWDEERRCWSGYEVYGIELLDGRYAKWENVELLALPPTLTEHIAAWRAGLMSGVMTTSGQE